MKYYLIDASAYIYAIENSSKLKNPIFLELSKKEAFVYIPQFCVTEVLNTFAKFYFRQEKISEAKYTLWKRDFIKSVKDRNLLYCYDLHRYHNINTDNVFRYEHRAPQKDKFDVLSSFDILIIAMGMELKKIHSPNDVIILSRDKRLIKISKMDENFASANWFN